MVLAPRAPPAASTISAPDHLTSFVLLVLGLAVGYALHALRTHRRGNSSAQTSGQSGTSPEFLRSGLEWCIAMSGAKRVILWRIDTPAGLVRPEAVAGGP